MNLCIDQGNSRTKVGVFNQDELLETFVYDQFGKSEISILVDKFSVNQCIVSSVISNNAALLEELETTFSIFLELSH